MKRLFFVLGAILFLQACATEAKYDKKLQSMVGKTEAQLISEWGAPSAAKILNNGEQVITYTQANDMYVPSEYYIYNTTGAEPSETVLYSPFMDDYYFGPYSQTFGYEVEEVCQTSFYIKDGIVSGWKWKGNNCVSN